MGEDEEYGHKSPELELPSRDIIIIPYNGGKLTASVFGPSIFEENLIDDMKQLWWNSPTHPVLSFRPATTKEALAVASYNFNEGKSFDPKSDIFDKGFLYIGRILQTSEGIFLDTVQTGEREPGKILDKLKKENEGTIFAPYGSFTRGGQDVGDFLEGGLAKILSGDSDSLDILTDHYSNRVEVELDKPSTTPNISDMYLSGWSAGRRLYITGTTGASFGAPNKFGIGVVDPNRSQEDVRKDQEEGLIGFFPWNEN